MNQGRDSLLTLATTCASGHVKMQGLWSQSVLLVLLIGGAKPFVRSVALAQPNVCGDKNSSNRSVGSLRTIFGKCQDTVAHWAAQLLASQYRCPVMVTVAIHTDSAAPQDTNELIQAIKTLVLEWTQRFPSRPKSADLQKEVEYDEDIC